MYGGWFFTLHNRWQCWRARGVDRREGAIIVFFHVDAITQMSFLDIFFCFWLKAKCFKRHLFSANFVCCVCATFHRDDVSSNECKWHSNWWRVRGQLRMGLNALYTHFIHIVCDVRCNKLKTVTVLCSAFVFDLRLSVKQICSFISMLKPVHNRTSLKVFPQKLLHAITPQKNTRTQHTHSRPPNSWRVHFEFEISSALSLLNGFYLVKIQLFRCADFVTKIRHTHWTNATTEISFYF